MCQLAKKQKKKYRKGPTRNRANVDLWGPSTVNSNNDGKLKMQLMIMIDPVSYCEQQ